MKSSILGIFFCVIAKIHGNKLPNFNIKTTFIGLFHKIFSKNTMHAYYF